MKVKVVAKAARRLNEVGRPGFLAAYLLLALREDGLGRVKLGRIVLEQLAEFANNLVAYQKLAEAFSVFLLPAQLERSAEALRVLETWEMNEPRRFQARKDVLAVKAHLEQGCCETDEQNRVKLANLLGAVNELWEHTVAVEPPQESQSMSQH